MRSPYTRLYVHLIWSTWKRQPLITEEIRPRLYAAIAAKCLQLQCEPVAIGGLENHLHLLVRFSPTVAISDLVKEGKSSPSHLVNHEIQ